MIRNVEFKHYFRVIDGLFYWKDKDAFRAEKTKYEGKNGYVIFFNQEAKATNDQYAFYFGFVIGRACAESNIFSGYNKHEIHMVLMKDLRSEDIVIPDKRGTKHVKTIVEDYHSWNKKKWASFIEEVVPHLQIEYGIDVEGYDNNKDYNYYSF